MQLQFDPGDLWCCCIGIHVMTPDICRYPRLLLCPFCTSPNRMLQTVDWYSSDFKFTWYLWYPTPWPSAKNLKFIHFSKRLVQLPFSCDEKSTWESLLFFNKGQQINSSCANYLTNNTYPLRRTINIARRPSFPSFTLRQKFSFATLRPRVIFCTSD